MLPKLRTPACACQVCNACCALPRAAPHLEPSASLQALSPGAACGVLPARLPPARPSLLAPYYVPPPARPFLLAEVVENDWQWQQLVPAASMSPRVLGALAEHMKRRELSSAGF